jgi:hypothetical protein
MPRPPAAQWRRSSRHPPPQRPASLVLASTLPTGRHPCRSGRTARGTAAPDAAWLPATASAGVLALCPPGRWSLRSCPRAYPHANARSKQGPFPPGGCLAALPRYFDPLGLPPDAAPFRTRLIDAALLQREPPGRVSPVPHRAVDTCRSPYPGGVQRCSDGFTLSVAFAVACPARPPLPFGRSSVEAAGFT